MILKKKKLQIKKAGKLEIFTRTPRGVTWCSLSESFQCVNCVYLSKMLWLLNIVLSLFEMREEILQQCVLQWTFTSFKNVINMCRKEQTLLNKFVHIFHLQLLLYGKHEFKY